MFFGKPSKKPSFRVLSARVMWFIKTGIVMAMLAGSFLTAFVNNPAQAETVIVSTFAGGRIGVADGWWKAARFYWPAGIAIDAAGNLYVADTMYNRIRKITPRREVSTLAGGEPGFADGQGSAARFHHPSDIAIDAAGNLYVADRGNARIRKVTPNGEVSTLAGSGKLGVVNGRGSAARFRTPTGITIDAAGNLYVTDGDAHRIRRITPKGKVSTLAGGSRQGFADGKGGAARFDTPAGIMIDAAGNLYVTDWGNHRIRKVTPEGEVSTLAGGRKGFADGQGRSAQFDAPSGIAIDAAGNLYVADSYNNRIRKVTPRGEVSTLVGSEETGFSNGQGPNARFDKPFGIAIDSADNLYVTDRWNNRIRKMTFVAREMDAENLGVAQNDGQTAIVSTVAGGAGNNRWNRNWGWNDGQGRAARFKVPTGITIDATGNLYVADAANHLIRKVTPKGEVSTLAGNYAATGSFACDSRIHPGFADGQGRIAQFHYPTSITIDAAGNLYVTDAANHRIRKVTPEGEVSTLTGGKRGFADGRGSVAQFNYPAGIAIDAEGNLYVTDRGNSRIRKVTPEGEVSTLAGGEQGFADGQGSVARFHHPEGIAIDAAGNLYVADHRNHRIRKVTPEGEVSTLAGDIEGFADEQGRFAGPSGIAVDATGNLYVTDMGNHRICKITPKGEISTLAGNGELGFADGEGSAAQFRMPSGIAIDAAGNLYVVDTWNHSIRKIVIQRSY